MNTTLPLEKAVGNCAATVIQNKERVRVGVSSKERVATRRVPRVGTLVGYMKDLNKFRKAYFVLVDVM